MLVLILVLPVLGKTEKFRAHELANTGAGYQMTSTSFTYLRLHESIQPADIDLDGNLDIVVLADGDLSQNNDFTSSGGNIESGDYLFGKGGDGRESPNVRLGKSCCYDRDTTGVRVGSDLAWYRNDGFGYFYPVFVTPWTGAISTHAFIYNGKTLAVDDLDNDGDTDIVVWTGPGSKPNDNLQGAQQVTWFENQWLTPHRYFIDDDIYPHFLQFSVVGGNLHPVPTFNVDGVDYSDYDPRAGAVACMNGDDTLKDLVVLDSDPPGSSDSGLYWIKNTGLSGVDRFQLTSGNIIPISVGTIGTYYKDKHGITIVAEDLNRDGRMDLVLGENGTSPSDREIIFFKSKDNDGKVFDKTTVKSNFPINKALAVADVIPGGCLEIIAGMDKSDSPLAVFINSLPECTGPWSKSTLPRANELPDIWDVRLVDLNGDDARPDVCALSVGNTLLDGSNSLTTCWINNSNNPTEWTPFPLVENKTPPPMATLGGGLAIGNFDRDGDMDMMRAHFETNLTFFENTWNTERQIQMKTTVTKNGVKQKVISVFGTKPDKTLGKMKIQKVQ